MHRTSCIFRRISTSFLIMIIIRKKKILQTKWTIKEGNSRIPSDSASILYFSKRNVNIRVHMMKSVSGVFSEGSSSSTVDSVAIEKIPQNSAAKTAAETPRALASFPELKAHNWNSQNILSERTATGGCCCERTSSKWCVFLWVPQRKMFTEVVSSANLNASLWPPAAGGVIFGNISSCLLMFISITGQK